MADISLEDVKNENVDLVRLQLRLVLDFLFLIDRELCLFDLLRT